MKKINKLIKYSFFIQLTLCVLVFNKFTGPRLLRFFGYSLFLLPFGIWIIDFVLVSYGIFLLIDHFFVIFPYKFCGLLGDYILLLNRKTYGILILIGIGIGIYFLTRDKDKVDNIFDVLDSPGQDGQKENHTQAINKLLSKYSIRAEIKAIEFGVFFSRYYLNIPKEVKFKRFTSLSPDFSSLIGLKARTFCDLEHSCVEVENLQKSRLYLREFSSYCQPNKIFMMDCRTPLLFDLKQNLLIHSPESVIISILTSILITRVDLDTLVIGDPDPSLLAFSNSIVNIPEINLEEVILEMERRYKIIIPLAGNIIDYNINHSPNINNLLVFARISPETRSEFVSHITRYGRKVGVFLYLYSDSKEQIVPFLDYFSSILTSPLQSKEESISIIGSTGAEYLVDPHDCFLKEGEMLSQVSLPLVSQGEIVRVVKYIEAN